MSEVTALLRETLRELVPYRVPVHKGVVKLDANENPYDFPPAVREAILGAVETALFTRYPDAAAEELREALAGYASVGPEQIMVGNGSDELILDLLLAFGTGRRVVIPVPTFGMYRLHAVIAGAEPVLLPRRELGLPVDAETLVRAAEGAAMVILCSPNNPTGDLLPWDTLVAVLERTGAVVVVDEAYYEFAGDTALPLLDRYPRLVLLRTFSKAFGLAGLRVGYMLGAPEMIGAVWRVKQPFNVNTFSQLAAVQVLRHRELFAGRIAEIGAERERLYEALREVPGVCALPSRANFILFNTPRPARDVYDGLLARGVLIRSMDGPHLPRFLRVTVGRPEENRLFITALREVCSA
ncbi:MAG: histidinol-phosphate transaminase [Thermoanaerobacterales bacterium]|nr:histidinol-phosphate transaminase [Thermoanaerobacterales bacterium]